MFQEICTPSGTATARTLAGGSGGKSSGRPSNSFMYFTTAW
jgi:hypothetical protein